MDRLTVKKKAKDKIAVDLTAIDNSIDFIAHQALAAALREEDEYRAYEIFDQVRHWAQRDSVTFDAHEYLDELRRLRDLSFLSGQRRITSELIKRLQYFEQHEDELQNVLDDFRRQHLYDGLRENSHLN